MVEDNSCDDSLRPNQIYAVSLPFTMLSEEQNKAIVEIELTSESDTIRFPEFLHVIREITNDLSYRNIALAKNQKL